MLLTPDSWICISLMCFFSLLFPSPLCVSHIFPSLPSSFCLVWVCSLIGTRRRACSACWEGAFCIKKQERSRLKRFSAIVVIRDFGKARHPHPSLSLSQVFQATVIVSIWSVRGGGGGGIKSLGCIGQPSEPGHSHSSQLSRATSRQAHWLQLHTMTVAATITTIGTSPPIPLSPCESSNK